MAANIDPIASKVGYIDSGTALIATAKSSLYGAVGTIGTTDMVKVWTADATNGGYAGFIRFKYGTTAGTTTASNACVAKIYVSTIASGSTTEVNTWLIGEFALAATSTVTTTAVASADYTYPLGFSLNPGYTILVGITVAQPASTGWVATVFGGKYYWPRAASPSI